MPQPSALLVGLIIAAMAASAWGGIANAQDQSNPTGQHITIPLGPPSGSTAETAGVRTSASATTTVGIYDFSFRPGRVTVNVGDTVQWTNNGRERHTATANDSTFDSGVLSSDQTYSYQFNNTGTYNYTCTIHPRMRGTVTVVQSGASSSSDTARSYDQAYYGRDYGYGGYGSSGYGYGGYGYGGYGYGGYGGYDPFGYPGYGGYGYGGYGGYGYGGYGGYGYGGYGGYGYGGYGGYGYGYGYPGYAYGYPYYGYGYGSYGYPSYGYGYGSYGYPYYGYGYGNGIYGYGLGTG
jgi:plastocyanin